MTIDQVIALSASVAAAISAFATLWTVREMRSQRELSQRPDLVILPIDIHAVEERTRSNKPRAANEDSDSGTGLLTYWKGTSGADLTTSGWHIAAAMPNIGVGAAKDIRVIWDAPIQCFVDKINALAQRALVPAFYEYSSGILQFKSETLGGPMAMVWDNTRQAHYDFALPANSQGEPLPLGIPYAFVHLNAAYLYLVQREREEMNHFLPLTANVRLDYCDIAGSEYQMVFDVAFEPIAFGSTECDARVLFRLSRSTPE